MNVEPLSCHVDLLILNSVAVKSLNVTNFVSASQTGRIAIRSPVRREVRLDYPLSFLGKPPDDVRSVLGKFDGSPPEVP